MLASPFPVQSDDEEKTNDAPEVSCLWVENFGSIGFKVEFDVFAPSDSDRTLTGFRLCRVDFPFPEDEEIGTSVTLKSDYCDWLSIPGYDGGPPLPYPGYLHSFDFIVKGLQHGGVVPLGDPDFRLIPVAISQVSISLYVTVNSEGALESMSAYAYDSNGDFYEVPLYYSPGGSENFRTFGD